MAYEITSNLVLPQLPTGPLEDLLPRTKAAIRLGSQSARAQWVLYATGQEPVRDGRRMMVRSGDYARSITERELGPFSWQVSSDSPHANALEDGMPAYDMKRALQTSAKVRISKDGHRYLIIPFRHGTPGSTSFQSVMPAAVHEAAKALSPSRIKSLFQVPNAIGLHSMSTQQSVMVTRRKYTYGDRLPAGLAEKSKPHHATDRFAGLMRFDKPGGGHSTYMTFRVMSDKSTGWIRPAVPGYHPARDTADLLRPKIEAMIQEALQADIAAFFPGQS